MNIHVTRILRLAQSACLSAVAALVLQGATWAQVEEPPAEPPEPAAGTPREDADPADDASRLSEPESAEDLIRQSESRRRDRDLPGSRTRRSETTRSEGRRAVREDDAGLDRDDARIDRDRSFEGDSPREPREVDSADESVTGRRTTESRQASGASRRSTSFRVEDLRAPDLGLWFNRNTRDGLVISNVAGSGAIAQFGFREGDQIVSVNGQRVIGERDFLHSLFADDIAYERVPVVVLRDNRRRLIYVRPDVFVSQTAAVDPLDRFGIVLDDRYVDRIVVWRVLPRSPAYYAGIRAGDVLTSFDGRPIADAGDLVRLIEITDPVNVAVEVSRNQQPRELYVDLAIAEPATEQRTSLRATIEEPLERDRVFDDIRSVGPTSDSERRLSPRPDVPPGIRIPGGDVGRDRGPIAPTGAEGGTPTTPMRLGFPR